MPKQLTSPFTAADDVLAAKPGTTLYADLAGRQLTAVARPGTHVAGELVSVDPKTRVVVLMALGLAELAQQGAPVVPDVDEAFVARPKDGNWFCWPCTKGRQQYVVSAGAPGDRLCEGCQKVFGPADLVTVKDEGYDEIRNSVQLLAGGKIVRNALDNRGNPLVITDDPATGWRTYVGLRGPSQERLT
jgi:hypothetical protein